MSKHYVVKATKDIGVLMEGVMHISAPSKRKAKKSFYQQFKNWQIVNVQTNIDKQIIIQSPEYLLEIDQEIIG